MSKFKVGDRVVTLVSNLPLYEKGEVGFVFRLGGDWIQVAFDNPKHHPRPMITTIRLEFEDIYNSPLYQALK